MTEEKEETQKTGLKPAQVVASALAAITAAFLGSTLGVGGTVAGAGIASIITTIGSEVYLRSLRRTKEAARKTAEVLALTDTRLRQETRFVEPPPRLPANPLIQPGPAQQGQLPATAVNRVQPTQYLPMAGAGQSGGGERTVYLPRPGAQNATAVQNATGAPTQVLAKPETKPKPPWWKNRWTLIAGTSVVAFLVGMLALTGFESLTGHAVSGGSGTTFGQVVGRSGGSATTTHETTTVTETQTSKSRPTATSTEQSETSVPSTTQQEQPSQSSASQTASATPTESAGPTSG
ncbi:hypothetical protein LWP59_35890 [Amycolatopsis acidiphila]|uniref:Uncharacterized protein n=1 Tax=Amycolatopsis acidiphila TaxID=715473 RepID=A0A558A2R8_9PSEU|nr:hypothetical protein [Amycolatopsis acidiphila]TVT18553.1 hypothetical protein FNH06_27390 [Amycolatopsis acidiphila]UIJ59367.1 hypothetical protein LWP59_35890 [Amycolatopsis acidiphila]GHG79933.1 hypothetical protein GCM10017788_48670 [Amycolatopsis acidiphila]